MEHASSSTSIALSGRFLSVMYRSDMRTAASRASSLIPTRWCFSYLSCSPRRISRHCSFVGSSTDTGWNRRSSAASFSIYFLYSAIVVAPISCSSPLASEGLRILDASMAPSAPPAPIMVWISSRNRMIFPSASTSEISPFILSSNSPLYFDPAISPGRSSVQILFPFIFSGTTPDAIRWASPSIMAVLPTPGSPIRHGLFLVRLLRTSISRNISCSRPTTGSSFPAPARAVISVQNCSTMERPPFVSSCISS